MTAAYETMISGCVRKTAITVTGEVCLSYIMADETFFDELGDGRHSYSFFAAICDSGGESDSACVHDVTSSTEEADAFFSLISEGAVTPCTLSVIAEEFIASR